MKKLFTSLVVAGTVASFAKCGKKAEVKPTTTETKKETKTTVKTVTKGQVAQGTFKVGYAGSNLEYTENFKSTLTKYTQDVENKAATGDEYFKLPSGLFLQSSAKFNSNVREGVVYKKALTALKTKLIAKTVIQVSDGKKYKKVSNLSTEITQTEAAIPTDIWFNITGPDTQTYGIFWTDVQIQKIYEKLNKQTPTVEEIGDVINEITGITLFETADIETLTSKVNNLIVDKGAVTTDTKEVIVDYVKFDTVKVNFKETSIKKLSDKTELASQNLDALFINVTDGVENKSDVYKAIVEKKEFKATNLFFVGNKAKSQAGASSKVFAGGSVSSASFNKYAAAYVAGFQAAVGAIKFSGSEDVYEETSVSFLIGATSDSIAKKKAFAFRRGVEAASAHATYSKYLKVKFVSKTEDSSKSSKKLYREVSEWKNREDSKSKLYEFSGSDTFSDADKKIVYIAGTTAEDWTGKDLDTDAGQWGLNDNTGLTGALYNYKSAKANDTDESLSSKTFARGVYIILDKDISASAVTKNALVHITNQDAKLERRDVKFMGFVGGQLAGTNQYIKGALNGLYMGKPNYMIGKHTVFGAPLEIALTTKSATGSGSAAAQIWTWTDGDKPGVWAAVSTVDIGKAKNRYKTSLAHAWATEVSEAELTKASPWLK